MANEKRKTLKDILGELEVTEKTHVKKVAMQKDIETSAAKPMFKAEDDITGLENKIPIVTTTDGLIKFDESHETDQVPPAPDNTPLVPMEETPPPIPKSSLMDSTEPGIAEPSYVPKPSSVPEPKNVYAESWASPQHLNKIETLEQQINKLDEETRKQKAIIASQRSEVNGYREKLGDMEAENKKLKSELSNAEVNVKIDFEGQLNKATIIEEKYNNLAKLHEEVKAKVRRDIRKIRTREKELANKLELMRHDSETLLTAKDHKILQLKQTIDNLEFEIETLKDKLQTLQVEAKENEEKAERVIKALRLSTSLLEVTKK